MKTFEEFLQDKFIEYYRGIKDDYQDTFDVWLSKLDGEEYINYANRYRLYCNLEGYKEAYAKAEQLISEVFDKKHE